MTNKLVSVLMPAYNAGNFIEQAIRSILTQSYTNIELLICEDCSSDNTWEIINSISDKRIRIFRNEKNNGYLQTCNFLFTQAIGDFITFQDADDWSDTMRIEKLIDAFAADPALGMCGSNYEKNYSNGETMYRSDLPLSNDSIVKRINVGEEEFPFCGGAVMIQKKVYDVIGGYRLYFNRACYEDYDWILRIMERFSVVNIAGPLYHYRANEFSVSRTITNPFSFYGEKVVRFLRQQRIENNGTDGLMEGGDKKTLDLFISELEKPYKEDRTLIYYIMMTDELNKRQYRKGLTNLFKIIFLRPFSLGSYKRAYYFLWKLKQNRRHG